MGIKFFSSTDRRYRLAESARLQDVFSLQQAASRLQINERRLRPLELHSRALFILATRLARSYRCPCNLFRNNPNYLDGTDAPFIHPKPVRQATGDSPATELSQPASNGAHTEGSAGGRIPSPACTSIFPLNSFAPLPPTLPEALPGSVQHQQPPACPSRTSSPSNVEQHAVAAGGDSA